MNNLALRIITALVGAAAIIGSIFWNAWSFAILFMIISVFTHYEYIKTIRNTTNKSSNFELIYSLLTGIFFILNVTNQALFHFEFLNWMRELLLISLLLFIVFELFYDRENPFQQIGLNILGIYYIPFAFGSFIEFGLRAGNNTVGIWFVIGLLFMVWFNDSFAYFAGRFFGKHKLFERISPKKTWEGFFGGMIMTIGCSIGFSFIFPELGILQWMVWAVLVVGAGTLGDLAESLLKRSIHIKDSSSLLPGHGGFLDRFDGFILVVPVSIAYLHLLALFHLL